MVLDEQEAVLARLAGEVLHEGITQTSGHGIADCLLAVPIVRTYVTDYLPPLRNRQYSAAADAIADRELRGAFRRLLASRIDQEYFADSIMLSVDLGRRFPVPTADIYALMRCVGMLHVMLPQLGHVVRAGIEGNWSARMPDGSLYGPARYAAFHLAREGTGYPRIVIGQQLVQFLRQLSFATPEAGATEEDVRRLSVEVGFARQCLAMVTTRNGGYELDAFGDTMVRLYESEAMLDLMLDCADASILRLRRMARQAELAHRAVAYMRQAHALEESIGAMRRTGPQQTQTRSHQMVQPAPTEPATSGAGPPAGAAHSVTARYYCVAVVDFLGQKEALKRLSEADVLSAPSGDTAELVAQTVVAVDALRRMAGQYCGMVAATEDPGVSDGCPPGGSSTDIQQLHMSDAIVLSVPVSEDVPAVVRAQSILRIFDFVANALPVLMARSLALRGAITIGWGAEITEGEFYGPGLYSAFNMEAQAGHPRIVVDRRLAEYLHAIATEAQACGDAEAANAAGACLSWLHEDEDGQLIVDYLGPNVEARYVEAAAIRAQVAPACLDSAVRLAGHYRGQGKERIAAKYDYVASYVSGRMAARTE